MPGISLERVGEYTTLTSETWQQIVIIILTRRGSLPLIPLRGGFVHTFVSAPITEVAKLLSECADLLQEELPPYITLEGIKAVPPETTGGKIQVEITVKNSRINKSVTVTV